MLENQIIKHRKVDNRAMTAEKLNFILNNKNKLTLREIAKKLKVPAVSVRRFFRNNDLLFLTEYSNGLRIKLLDIAIKDGERNLTNLSQKSYLTVERIEAILSRQDPILYNDLVNSTYGTNREVSFYTLKTGYDRLRKEYNILETKYNNIIEKYDKQIKCLITEYFKNNQLNKTEIISIIKDFNLDLIENIFKSIN